MKATLKLVQVVSTVGLFALFPVSAGAQQPPPPAQPPQAQPQPQPPPQPPPPQPPPPQPPPPQPQAQGEVGTALPPKAAEAQGTSDHDAMVGRLAVGYLGRRDMLLGNAGIAAPGMPIPAMGPVGCPDGVRGGGCIITAPVVGIRYWINQLVGIDAGVGFYMSSGTVEDTTNPPPVPTSQDIAGVTAFLFHAGVPLSLASSQHFSFQITPELNVGFAHRTVKSPNPAAFIDKDDKGFHVDVGARFGAEIHFGFINIPQLSLQASVGVLYETNNYGSEGGPAKSNQTLNEFRTSTNGEPWSIFTGNVGAFYYF